MWHKNENSTRLVYTGPEIPDFEHVAAPMVTRSGTGNLRAFCRDRGSSVRQLTNLTKTLSSIRKFSLLCQIFVRMQYVNLYPTLSKKLDIDLFYYSHS